MSRPQFGQGGKAGGGFVILKSSTSLYAEVKTFGPHVTPRFLRHLRAP